MRGPATDAGLASYATRVAYETCPLGLISVSVGGPFGAGRFQGAFDRVQGNWVVTAVAGQEIPAGAHVALVITGDKFQSVKNGTVDERGTLKLDATKMPMWFDFVITEGPFAGKLQLGLADVAGDALTLTLAEPGDPVRPLATAPNKVTSTRLKPIAKQFEGAWEGGVSSSLRMVVRLSNGSDGLASGTLVSVDQGGVEVPIAAVVQNGTRLRLLPSIRGMFDGELKDGELTGTFTQGRAPRPLVLKRPK